MGLFHRVVPCRHWPEWAGNDPRALPIDRFRTKLPLANADLPWILAAFRPSRFGYPKGISGPLSGARRSIRFRAPLPEVAPHLRRREGRAASRGRAPGRDEGREVGGETTWWGGR